MSDNNIRYEITHDGKIVEGVTALSSDMAGLIRQLFSQYGWTYSELSKQGTYRKISVIVAKGHRITINLFAGNIRNEKRNSYEKKIQLSKSDPRQYKDGATLILGFYVSKPDDTLVDSIVVGYPVDETVKYETNPSLRGVFVNDILIKAKENGIYVDEVRRTVGFRPEFLLYYLKSYSFLHQYTDGRYTSKELDVLNQLADGQKKQNRTQEDSGDIYELINIIKNEEIVCEDAIYDGFDLNMVELAIKTLESEREILKFDSGKYISIKRLLKNGIGRKELDEYCNRIFEFAQGVTIFSSKSLSRFNICPEIDDLGFGEEFYCSLLLSDTRFFRRLVENRWLFSTKIDKISIIDVIQEYVEKMDYVSVDELINGLFDMHGLCLERNSVLARVKDTKLYYDKILDYIYKDYETYYQDV